MSDQYIVVEDPENRYFEGSLIDPKRAAPLQARGVAMLPCCPTLFGRSGAGGYFKRSWGAGWPLDAQHPMIAAQMVLFCGPEHPGLHWVARLAPSEEARINDESGFKVQGQLRIAADSGQRTPNNCRLTPVDRPIDCSRLGKPDARGGWTVRGKATIHCSSEAIYGFALYGHAPGLRVLWAAISCTVDR